MRLSQTVFHSIVLKPYRSFYMKTVIAAVVLVFTLFITDAFAFYCGDGDQLVSEGDRAAEVIMKCGEPFSRESHTEYVVDEKEKDPKHAIEITVEDWTYNFGPNSWIYLLRFENGLLVKIDTRGYGN